MGLRLEQRRRRNREKSERYRQINAHIPRGYLRSRDMDSGGHTMRVSFDDNIDFLTIIKTSTLKGKEQCWDVIS